MTHVRVLINDIVPKLFSNNIGQKLANIQGIEADLMHVRACCSKLLEASYEPFDVVERSLLDSAMIRYRRCFKTGVRTSLSNAELKNFDRDLIECHNYGLSMTDKYVAHSVNKVESLVAVVLPGNHAVPTLGHAVLAFDLGGEPRERVELFFRLASDLIDNVIKPRKQLLEAEFEKEVKNLDFAQVTRMKDLSIPTGRSIKTVSMSR